MHSHTLLLPWKINWQSSIQKKYSSALDLIISQNLSPKKEEGEKSENYVNRGVVDGKPRKSNGMKSYEYEKKTANVRKAKSAKLN